MRALIEYDKVADARAHLKGALDYASDGTPVTVRRNHQRFALVDADRLREALSASYARAQVVAEGDGWSLFFPGLPIAAEGDTIDEAFDDAIVVLREYAQDWVDHLYTAPNHVGNWGLVQLVELSSDDNLRAWLQGSL